METAAAAAAASGGGRPTKFPYASSLTQQLCNDNAVRYDPDVFQDDDGRRRDGRSAGGRIGIGNSSDGLPYVSPRTPVGMLHDVTAASSSNFSSRTLRVMTVIEDGRDQLAFSCYDQARNEITLDRRVFSPSSSSSSTETADVLLEEVLQITRPTLLILNNRIVHNEALFDVLTRPFPPPPTPTQDKDDDEEDDNEQEEKGGENGNKDVRGGKQNQQQHDTTFTPSTIPYKIMKSKIFDHKTCMALIVEKLHVLSLSRRRAQPSQHYSAAPSHHHNNNSSYPYNDPYSYSQQDRYGYGGGSVDDINDQFLFNSSTYQASNYHSLATVIDFDSKVTVQALGSLLSFLVTNLYQSSFHYQPTNYDSTNGEAHDGGNGVITVNRIIPVPISKYMRISPPTMSALQIFSTEQHPLVFAEGRGNSKEGFSLYSFLDRTKSRGGRQKLREWMMKPLAKLDDIVVRHGIVEFFLQSSIERSVGQIMRHLKTVRSIDKIISRMNKIATRPRDFLDLSSTLTSIIGIATILNEVIIPQARNITSDNCFEYLTDLYSRCHSEVMIDLKTRILGMIDEEATSQRGNTTVEIRYGFDERLDEFRRQEDEMDEVLYQAGRSIDDRLQHTMTQATIAMMMMEASSRKFSDVEFLSQTGFLVGFRMGQVMLDEVLPDDFELIMTDGGKTFYACAETRVLDDQYGDFVGLRKDLEQEILEEMEGNILDTEVKLQECFDAMSELDCFLSFAEVACDSNFTKPRMVDGGGGGGGGNTRRKRRIEVSQDDETSHSQVKSPSHIVEIHDGRHPLQELTSQTIFVPNDVYITNNNSVNVITGPNFSGKSCYVRQVGILVYMAHIGSFIPCSSATISVMDSIAARIPTAESCSRPQSSFQQELTEISSMLRRATSKSLVIIDEFGKGTNPVSGISLLGATLKHLAKTRCLTVCATHLLELFSMNVISDGKEGIHARRMTMRLPEGDSGGKAVPLFKIEDGISPSSAATVCAESARVARNVLDRTKQIVQARRSHNSIFRLWSMDQGRPLIPAQLQLLATFASNNDWSAEKKEEVSSLVSQAAKMLDDKK